MIGFTKEQLFEFMHDRTPIPPIFNQVIAAYKASQVVKEGPKE